MAEKRAVYEQLSLGHRANDAPRRTGVVPLLVVSLAISIFSIFTSVFSCTFFAVLDQNIKRSKSPSSTSANGHSKCKILDIFTPFFNSWHFNGQNSFLKWTVYILNETWKTDYRILTWPIDELKRCQWNQNQYIDQSKDHQHKTVREDSAGGDEATKNVHPVAEEGFSGDLDHPGGEEEEIEIQMGPTKMRMEGHTASRRDWRKVVGDGKLTNKQMQKCTFNFIQHFFFRKLRYNYTEDTWT